MPKFDETARQLCNHAYNGQLEQLKLLAKSTNCNLKCSGFTPLMKAASAPADNGIQCAKYLLKLGADILVTDGARQTAMHLAAMFNNVGVMKLLSQYSELLNCQTELLETPLMYAASFNNVEAVRLLVQWGANICLRDNRGRTAADRAKQFDSWASFIAICSAVRHSRVSDLTDDRKAKMIKMEKSARRLCYAAASGDVRELRKLATQQNCNRRWRGHTPLMRSALAVSRDGLDCAIHLINIGANVNLADPLGCTVAHYAANCGNTELLMRLPQACIELSDNGGYTPLMLAAGIGRFGSVQALIERRANLHAIGKDGYTAVMAAECGGYDSVKKLLDSINR